MLQQNFLYVVQLNMQFDDTKQTQTRVILGPKRRACVFLLSVSRFCLQLKMKINKRYEEDDYFACHFSFRLIKPLREK